MLATHNRFYEITAATAAHRVDRVAGKIHGVKIVGMKSRNGREYPADSLREAIVHYEGAKVFLNHQRKSDYGEDRPWQDWVGVLSNVRFDRDGLYGDLDLLKESRHFSALCEAAEKFGGSWGLSHEADGESRYINGVDVVETITSVGAVAVVTDPATTAGLFESVGGGSNGGNQWQKYHQTFESLDAGRRCEADGPQHEPDPDYGRRFEEAAKRAEAKHREQRRY